VFAIFQWISLAEEFARSDRLPVYNCTITGLQMYINLSWPHMHVALQ